MMPGTSWGVQKLKTWGWNGYFEWRKIRLCKIPQIIVGSLQVKEIEITNKKKGFPQLFCVFLRVYYKMDTGHRPGRNLENSGMLFYMTAIANCVMQINT